MSITPVKTKELIELEKIVKKRLSAHGLTYTKNKSKVLEIMFHGEDHLSVEEIVTRSKIINEKIPMTTVYRIMSEFETFGIVESITIDDTKRYEISYLKQPHYHIYCTECHEVKEFENKDIHNMFLKELDAIDFKAINFNVIISGVCAQCHQK